MDMDTLRSFDWGIMAPEFIILGTATLLSLIDMFLGKEKSRRPLALFGLAGIVAAIVFLLFQLDHPVTMILNETYRLDSFSKAFKLILLSGAGLIMILAMDYEQEKLYRGEFYYLLLAALLGAMMMASSADMITLFVGLELLSLSSYIMAGLRKTNLQSNEAAFKYIVNGGIATAFVLFGMSYVYGLSGSTNLYVIGEELMGNPFVEDNAFLVVFSFVLIFVGLSFKIATAPFHMWVADVYQGSPTPVTAFLSVVSKTAGFVILLRFFLLTFFFAPGWNSDVFLLSTQPYIAIIAGLTMIIGNVIALRQRNIKRMFAYSSIAHAGYLLVPFVALSQLVFQSTWFYLVAYLLMNIGAFAIIQIVTTKEKSEDLRSFAGLYKRAPFAALAMTVFILSLAGIPATVGFVAKYTILMGALGTGTEHYVLAGILMATTVISYFYYFNVLAQMYFRPSSADEQYRLPAGIRVVISLCIVGTIAFGLVPGLAFDFFNSNFNMLDMFPTR
jgi:NADH-quinone oxidoreductase subunit N